MNTDWRLREIVVLYRNMLRHMQQYASGNGRARPAFLDRTNKLMKTGRVR